MHDRATPGAASSALQRPGPLVISAVSLRLRGEPCSFLRCCSRSLYSSLCSPCFSVSSVLSFSVPETAHETNPRIRLASSRRNPPQRSDPLRNPDHASRRIAPPGRIAAAITFAAWPSKKPAPQPTRAEIGTTLSSSAQTPPSSPAGEILAKPESDEDARRMLRLLSGATHEVHTGLALLLPAR